MRSLPCLRWINHTSLVLMLPWKVNVKSLVVRTERFYPLSPVYLVTRLRWQHSVSNPTNDQRPPLQRELTHPLTKQTLQNRHSTAMAEIILSINAGSSSVKVSVYTFTPSSSSPPTSVADISIAGLTAPPVSLTYSRGDTSVAKKRSSTRYPMPRMLSPPSWNTSPRIQS